MRLKSAFAGICFAVVPGVAAGSLSQVIHGDWFVTVIVTGAVVGLGLQICFDKEEFTLWHPESSGMRVTVVRGMWGQLTKPKYFATLDEARKYRKELNGRS